MVYQEDVAKIAIAMGLRRASADGLRKILSRRTRRSACATTAAVPRRAAERGVDEATVTKSGT